MCPWRISTEKFIGEVHHAYTMESIWRNEINRVDSFQVTFVGVSFDKLIFFCTTFPKILLLQTEIIDVGGIPTRVEGISMFQFYLSKRDLPTKNNKFWRLWHKNFNFKLVNKISFFASPIKEWAQMCLLHTFHTSETCESESKLAYSQCFISPKIWSKVICTL